MRTTQILSSDGHVTGLAYRDRDTEEIIEIDVLGVFVQIGLLPNTDFLNGVVELNRHGEIIIDDAGATSEPGIFACGDVTTVPYSRLLYQLVREPKLQFLQVNICKRKWHKSR